MRLNKNEKIFRCWLGAAVVWGVVFSGCVRWISSSSSNGDGSQHLNNNTDANGAINSDANGAINSDTNWAINSDAPGGVGHDARQNSLVDGLKAGEQIITRRDLGAKREASIPPTNPCVSGANDAMTYAVDMHICAGGTSATACQIEATTCNTAGGWHVCTATEFLARGGKTMAATQNAWLKSCLRDSSGQANAPSDNYCTVCGNQTGTTIFEVISTCANPSSFTGSNYIHLAVRAASTCNLLGPSAIPVDPRVPAYWSYSIGATIFPAAVCCY